MTGLEDRLRGVSGVSDIVVELGDDGLEGIRVRMHDGTDEADVLEEIRRILVAYGLKGTARDKGVATGIPSLELGADSGNSEHEDQNDDGAEVVPTEAIPEPTIIPAGDMLTIRLSDGSRLLEATSDATPLGAADAMIRALCEWRDVSPPTRLAIDRLDLDGSHVVILVGRKDGETVVGSALVDDSLAVALRVAADQVISGLGLS